MAEPLGRLGRYAGMSVLIIDDNELNLALLKAAVERAGLTRVYTEADSRQVPRWLAALSPDLVILDLHMPVFDGHQILAQIREHAAGSYLPVLIMTGDNDAQARYRMLRDGAQDFLLKPVDIIEATLRIANLLETRHLYETVRRGRRWLSASGELTNQLVAGNVERPMTRIAESARIAAEADFAILSVPHGKGKLRVAAVSGESVSDLADRITPLETSVAARALRTGEPELVYRSPEADGDGPIDIAGGPLITAPLIAGDHVLGALVLGRKATRPALTEGDRDLGASFATQAAVALDLVDARDAELRLARMEDRDRIAADIHDHVIQELFAVSMGLEGLASVTDNPAHGTRIAGYVASLDNAVRALRATIFQVQSERDEPSGLRARILAIANEHVQQLGYTPDLRFEGLLDLAINDNLADDVLAVTREAISNCARHAHAHTLEISVALHTNMLTVDITDDGVGIGNPTRSSGLNNMRVRAERHGGTFTTSTPPSGGTRLTWTAAVPIPEHALERM